jgi:hypothetical protein
LEWKLAGFVHSYINACQSGEYSRAADALQWVCAGFEYLLGHLLDGRGEWRGWVDGVIPATDMLPDAIRLDSPLGLTVSGTALWAKSSRGPFWIEPFRGSVSLAVEEDALVDYELCFGDATKGLAAFPYGKHVRCAEWYLPREWLFEFSNGGVFRSDSGYKPS